jgi:hypothetical protein
VILDHVVVSSQASAVTLKELPLAEQSVVGKRLVMSALCWAINDRSVASSFRSRPADKFHAMHPPFLATGSESCIFPKRYPGCANGISL